MRQQILLNKSSRKFLLLIALLLLSANSVVLAQTSTFTYQGRLTDGGTPATGIYDLQFALFDSASSGAQIGSNQTVPSVSVSSGIFTVSLDFGANAFTGANRFLEISTRLANNGSYTLLTPRQQITSTPYAVRSLGTAVADGLSGACASCVQDANINSVAGSKVSGPIPVTSVPGGSASYVQNRTSEQASTSFNVSGNGTAGGTLKGDVVNAVTQYNLNSNRVLSVAGTDNTFVGINAGTANTNGSENSFFGRGSGLANTTGHDNAFFGYQAGNQNTNNFNSFFGSGAGAANTTGLNNAFFGRSAGSSNTTAAANSFFGVSAGGADTTGDLNSFFGALAGGVNTTGSSNSFFGQGAGYTNTTGYDNTAIGDKADVGSINLNHATAIGAGAVVSSSNTIALGRADGSDYVVVPGFLTIPNLAVAGNTQLCRNSFDRVGTCSSSLRYKTNLAPYRSGLSVVNRLHPISFTWKEGGLRDLGFGAEDVEKIDPLLVTYNKAGQVEGVKYDRINVVLVNAITEQQQQIGLQQRQIDAQHKQNEEQRRQIESLKRLVCLSHSKATICK
jgi:hypothetical protein